jgi:hypothetical protein
MLCCAVPPQRGQLMPLYRHRGRRVSDCWLEELSLPTEFVETIGQPSETLRTAGFQLEVVLSRSFETRSDLERNFQKSP